MELAMKISKSLENLVYLFVLVYPKTSAELLHRDWKKNKILREYNRPPVETLRLWMQDFREELGEKGVKFN
jgi:hypothetical protein